MNDYKCGYAKVEMTYCATVMERIESKQNPRVKQLVKLRKRKYREAYQQYLIEGCRETMRALEGFAQIKELYVCRSFAGGEELASIVEMAKRNNIAIFELGQAVFEAVSYREGPDGILAVANACLPSLDSLQLSAQPLLLIADGLEKPGNLGALLRVADSAGADALICCDLQLDVFNPNVIRASQGAFFSTPTYVGECGEVTEFLKARGITICVTSPRAVTCFWDADLSGPTAIVVGNEHAGLSDAWLQQADVTVSIPQRGQSDSLNVAAAATLMLYESLRQRGLSAGG